MEFKTSRSLCRRRRRVWPCFALLVSLVAAAFASARPAFAQQCDLDGLPAFAGHNFPLQPQLGSIGVTRSFPSLSMSGREPLYLASEPLLQHPDPTGVERLYLVQRNGLVVVIENLPGVSDADIVTFLDITAKLAPVAGEGGLLGFAFDPDFWSNGYFYVMYSALAATCADQVPGLLKCNRVERYQATGLPPVVTGGGNPLTLLEIPQPDANHNGGALQFGPDGMLYVSVGDGGNSSLRTSQDLTDVKGSLLRLDPHAAPPYIPPDNPFVDVPGAAEEIFHLGLRNPWRFSFDRLTGDLWIGDVGSDTVEEIDYLPAGTPGGANFGWPDCEGDISWGGNPCDPADPDLEFPVLMYGHDSEGGGSVTGGYVYRGSRVPSLYGFYLYGDWVSNRIWAWDRTSADPVVIDTGTVDQPASFGEGIDGELYVVSLLGRLYHFEETAPGGGGGPPPATLSATGLFQDVANLVPAPGLLEYDVTSPLWSDRASKRRWLALPAGGTVGFDPTEGWVYPVGTAFVKHFELEVAPAVFRRLETRVLLLQQTGWVGYTYRWNPAETDADLLPGALLEVFDIALPGEPSTQTWSYPGPTDCIGCHSAAGDRVLGARTRQLNRDFDYTAVGGGIANQLESWSCAGILGATVIGDASVYDAWVPVDDTNASLDQRVRSYFASNCEFCHQPLGTAPGSIDFRYDTHLDDMNLVGVAPQSGDFGLPSPARIDPGDHVNSILWQRLETSDPDLHMASGTLLLHQAANSIVADWIDQELIDPDGDGYRSYEDNCPLDANGPQSGPDDQGDQDSDGIGNVCECSYVPGAPLVADADFNRNGVVVGGDYSIWADHYLMAVGSFDEGDANCDGFVDDADLAIWEAGYQPSAPPPLASRGIAPVVGGGLGLMAASFLAFRIRRSR